jgi:hypothetical protein
MKSAERTIPVIPYFMILIAFCLLWKVLASAQQLARSAAQTASSQAVVPRLVRFTGTAKDLNGNPLTGIVGITFAMYTEQSEGTPLWLETQNVQADKNGHYTVLLGDTKPEGLPVELFVSGEARWVGAQLEGQPEQTRVLLVAVPYALKAGDAETVGGLSPSAFALANQVPSTSGTAKAGAAGLSSAASAPKSIAPLANPAVTGKGVVDYIPMWDATSDIADSVIFQKSSQIGIGTTTPAATLDINGKGDVRDTLTLFPKGTDSTLAINGTAFKVDQTGKVAFVSGQTFPGAGTITGVTTAAGSGLSGGGTSGKLTLIVPSAGITNTMLQHSSVTLNSTSAGGLTAPGAMALGKIYSIGLKTCAANQILEYSGTAWNCSSAGLGTITGITAGSGLSGGGFSGNVGVAVDSTVARTSTPNSFTGQQSVIGNLAVAGNMQIAGKGNGLQFADGTSQTTASVSSGWTGPSIPFQSSSGPLGVPWGTCATVLIPFQVTSGHIAIELISYNFDYANDVYLQTTVNNATVQHHLFYVAGYRVYADAKTSIKAGLCAPMCPGTVDPKTGACSTGPNANLLDLSISGFIY